MAASTFVTSQYTSEEFVESCGTVLLDLSQGTGKVCLIYYRDKDEWLLPKGRRNCGETRQQAALREAREETGYPCHLHAVTMPTRCPPNDEKGHVADLPRVYRDITEPFFLTIRATGTSYAKIIFWYIAAVDNDAPIDSPHGEVEFDAKFFSLEQAAEKLTFQDDREILQRVIALFQNV